MKNINKLYKYFFLLFVLVACEEELRDLSFTDAIAPPTNVTAAYDVTQDNTGVVTITPAADGAVSFEIYFGDTTSEPAKISLGENVTHTYAEGTYNVKIVGINVKGDETETTQQLVVSFKAPENLVATIENDAAVSKKVNVKVTADFATTFDFYSGEPNVTQPVVSGNIGDVVSYQYTDPGTYSVKVVAKGAAIATTEYTEDFEVTEILAPTSAAPTPPTRNDADVISMFSEKYTNVNVDTWNTSWSDATFEDVDVDGNNNKKYSLLGFNGIETTSNPIDASGMTHLHLDIWTPNMTQMNVKLVSFLGDGFGGGNGDSEAELSITPTIGEWTSVDIPLEDFTNAGLTSLADLNQYIIVGTPYGTSIAFIDNVYFYRPASSTVVTSVQDFESGAPTFTVFGNIAATEVVANPDASGLNTSANVAKLTKSSGSQVWAGTFFEVSSPLDLVNNSKISIKTWSPKSGITVKMKLENVDASITHEVDVTNTTANAWEQLEYDFSAAPTADYVRIVVFFDFGTAGDDSEYYFDEVNLVDDSGNSGLGFQDFEGTAPTFTVFGNIAATEVIDNPDASGLNTTAKVAQLTKTSGSEVWAGTFFEVDTPLDFATYSKISMKAWSPKSGITVKMKLENSDASITHEVDVTNTATNSWEELVYDFSGAPTADYVRVVVFFDFGTAGDDSLYYFDELKLTN